jgi:hypothetical protein
MCSQYSAAEFPQRGDNPGTWRGSTPRGSRDRELQTHQVGKGRVAWRQTTGRRRLIACCYEAETPAPRMCGGGTTSRPSGSRGCADHR